VQQRFPDVGQVGVDQGDFGLATFTQGSTQAGGKFQSAGTAADNYYLMSHQARSQGF
jgi:hypothetical protein